MMPLLLLARLGWSCTAVLTAFLAQHDARVLRVLSHVIDIL